MATAEVLIVGAGPAGCAAALNLAPLRRTVMVERRAETPARIGESLPPVAGRLLADMGLLEGFERQGHAPRHGFRSSWGGQAPSERHGLRDPDGPGWHLDRAQFDSWLRGIAVARGAELLAPATLTAVTPAPGGWQVRLATPAGERRLEVPILIDAGGRRAGLARRLGARRRVRDRLVSLWAHGRVMLPVRHAGVGHLEAVADGWWYSAPIPGGRRVLAFHTDADLPAARAYCGPAALLDHLRDAPGTAELLAECGFAPDGPHGIAAAHGCALDRPAGPGWLAVGDAALACDPLSSQGLLNALYTGLAAAEAADRSLAGTEASADYIRAIRQIDDAYRRHLALWYGLEQRWPDAPFWSRRRAAPAPAEGLHEPVRQGASSAAEG